jgi:multidrug efflux pump subunit AcrA (membrane-fusion protein)
VTATRRPLVAFLALGALLALLPGTSRAEGEEPETVTVRRAPLGEKLELKGAVEPRQSTEVVLEFEAWRGDLEVLETFAGGMVVKGQTLLRLETKEYARQLSDAERDLALARLAFDRRQKDEALAERERAIAREEAARSARDTQENLDRFEKTERQIRLDEAEFNVEGTRIRLQNDKEELDQLEKMYSEDDLTEETEEIVLKRTRRNYERFLRSFEWQKVRTAWWMKDIVERQHPELMENARKAALKLERLDAVARLDDERRSIETAKAKEELDRKAEHVDKLRRDGALFEVKAPVAGMALAAAFRGGAWEGLDPGPEPRWRVGEQVKAGNVLYTVFDPKALRVRTTVKEEDLSRVSAGLLCTLKTPVTGKAGLEGEVEWLGEYPSKGVYGVLVRLKTEEGRLRAGNACTIEIASKDDTPVLSVPASCLKAGEEEGTAVLFVVSEAGVTPTTVKVGRKVAGRVEILEGVDAGVRVLKTPPKAE